VSNFSELQCILDGLKCRSKVLSAVRSFFERHDFVETETPAGILAPAAEEYIDSPCTDSFFLRSSPELQMKRLVCAGMKNIYQIGPCFRAGENGRLHRQEFSMLEWYMAGADYLDMLNFTRNMVRDAVQKINQNSLIHYRGEIIDVAADWEMISVRDAFKNFAGANADDAASEEGLFELILTEKVEPALPKNRPCVLIDYPVRFGAFARAKKEDPTLAERWELYIGGVELANAYGELTDAQIQRERFNSFARTRQRMNLKEYPVPTAFLEALDHGMPESTGCALGFDRLVMLIAGADSLAEVTFPLDS